MSTPVAAVISGMFTRKVDDADLPATRNGLSAIYREVEVAQPAASASPTSSTQRPAGQWRE